MRRFRGSLTILALGFAILAAPTRAEEPLADLIRRVPGTANTLAVIDVKTLYSSVKALYSSPIGRPQG